MLTLARLTYEDRGWKGTCGRKGEIVLVWSKPKPRPYVEGTHDEFGFSARAFMREHFEPIPFGLTGWRMFFRALPDAIRSARFKRAVRRSLARP